MEQYQMEQEFKRMFREADSNKKQEILGDLYKYISQIEAEKNRKKAFFHAVKNGYITAVSKIISEGIDINQKDNELGNTALFYAVGCSNIKLIQLLLENGASPHIKNKKRVDSIDAAKYIGNKEILILLSQK